MSKSKSSYDDSIAKGGYDYGIVVDHDHGESIFDLEDGHNMKPVGTYDLNPGATEMNRGNGQPSKGAK